MLDVEAAELELLHTLSPKNFLNLWLLSLSCSVVCWVVLKSASTNMLSAVVGEFIRSHSSEKRNTFEVLEERAVDEAE